MKILASSICPPRLRFFSVAWIGVAVSVAGIAASVAQQKKQAAAQKAAQAQAMGGLNAGAKPKAAEYVPVDFTDEQLHGILGNLKNEDDANSLMKATNADIDRDAMNRAIHFIPGYRESMRAEGSATNDLLNGRLPYDDVLGIVGDRSALTNSLGVPGTGSNATLRDLGLSRLDAIKTGSGLMQNMVQIADQINPVSRRMRPQDMFVSPTDRINLAMTQNQLIQNSNQNKYNIAAGISPTQQAQQQMALTQAFGPQGQGVDWASLATKVAGSAQAAYQANNTGGTYSTATDPQLYRGDSGYYYTRPTTSSPATSVPKLSDRPYSIPA